jgi:MFS family permease
VGDPQNHGRRHPLGPTVRRFGWISLANDAASEMVTPLIPLLLIGPLGASAAVVGLVEGLAQAACEALKWASGLLADRRGGHLRLVIGGYALSNFVRPLLGLATGPAGVMVLRTLDRLGKGIRTAPRDALLAQAAVGPHRARAFGFQRSMDHLGAALGPLIAFVMLEQGASIATTILWSFVPALVTLALFHRFDPPAPTQRPARATTWADLGSRGRRLVVAATVLASSNLPEALLVVWLHEEGHGAGTIVLIWAAAHVVKSLVAYPAGALADRIGRRRVIAGGWLLRALLLALAAAFPPPPMLALLVFLAYAGALAASEGAERGLIADAAPESARGAAFGAYAALPGLAALPGGVLFGLVWARAGADAVFALAAAAAALASLLLLRPVARGGA